ncbi:hypothetical protein [Rhizobium sp. AG855]|uniref:hypothetical protein n=1 Tax=Rhizobium sp. AG855 TaxID=2183898 RepID=UPI000E70DAC0|nr:hypothetical protein [Rhizobium sp. AG855]RKE86262.1 putative transposase [Rhizobium sp. AG855]
MSVVPDRFQFLNPVHKLLNPSLLCVPAHDSSVGETQQFKLNVNDRYYLYTPDHESFGHFIVKQWLHKTADTPAMVVFEDVQFGAQVYLTHFQIAHLNANSQIRPVYVSEKEERARTPGSALMLKQPELDVAARKAAYVNAILEACVEQGLAACSRKIIDQIRLKIAAERNETAPSTASCYRWLQQDRDGRHFDRMLALAPKLRTGNRRQVFAKRVEAMVALAVQDAWSDPEGTWHSVKARIAFLCSPDGEYADLQGMFENGEFKMSDRTLQRRLQDTDHFTRDLLRYGPEFAERKHASRIRVERPTRPLDVVDIDHTTLNIVVIDDEMPIAFGRPDLLTFRDRHSGILLGFELSFGPPSFDVFLSGLRNAMFPKRPEDLPEGMAFPWHGRATCLGLDNAKHFIEKDIRNAAVQLGFQIVEYRPGHPHEKGAEEHLFHLTDCNLVHRLPGSTTGSIDERQLFDEVKKKGIPVLTLQEVRGFLYRYYGEVYNRQPHAGLGHIARAKGIPAELWEKGIPLSEPARPVDEQIFIRLAGNTKELTIQSYGVQWEHIIYQSHALNALKLHPKHKKGKRYRFVRDPKNLEKVWVHDPYQNRVFAVPATPSDQKYASGLSRFQHKKVMEYHLKHHKKIESAAELLESKNALQNELMDFHALRVKHNIAQKLARFISSNRKRLEFTKTIDIEPTPVGGGRIDLVKPKRVKATEPRSKRAGAKAPPLIAAAPDVTEPSVNTKDTSRAADEIADIRARNTDWDD